jgi:hypothetical protein
MFNQPPMEEDDDENSPYDAVSSRPPIESPRSQVMNFISQKNASSQPSNKLEDDPLMSQYLKEQSDLDDYRKVKLNADTASNIGQSLSQMALGANTPQANPVYKNIDTQNQQLLSSKEQDMDRRRKVLDAIEARKARQEYEEGRRQDRQLHEKELAQNRNLIREDHKEKEAKLSDKQMTEMQDFDDSLDSMKSIVSQLGSHSDWTGPMDGRMPDALVGADQVAFRSELGRMVDKYRKLITGAGASNQELKKLESRLPSATDTYSNFVAKSKNFIDQVERAKGRYVKGLKGQGKNTAPFEGSPSAQTEKSASNKVVVSNGQETLSIDPSDLADAEKDGYRRL